MKLKRRIKDQKNFDKGSLSRVMIGTLLIVGASFAVREGFGFEGNQILVEINASSALYLEAEAGMFSGQPGFAMGSDTTAFEGQYIYPTANDINGPGSNRVRYNFTVEAGNYKIWGRVKTPSADDDSFWVSVDDGPFVKWNSIPASGNSWRWDDVHDSDNNNNVVVYSLTDGQHTLEIANREDGVQLDRIYISSRNDTPGDEYEGGSNDDENRVSGDGVDWVNGDLIQFNDNGGWCWYQDERVIVDSENSQIVLGSVASGGSRSGDVEIVNWNMTSQQGRRFSLATMNYPDDHDAPAIIQTPVGGYAAMWAGHNDDCYSYYNTYKGSAWSTTQTFDWRPYGCPTSSGKRITYANMWYLGDTLHSLVRSLGTSPNYLYTNDHGSSWNLEGRLTSTPLVGYVAGYYKYWGNNSDRIDFLGTEAHPRDNDNSLYHGYRQGRSNYNSYGQVIDSDATDRSAQDIVKYTQVFATGTTLNGLRLEHLWNADLVRYDDGTVAAIGTARVSGTGSSDPDKRLLYFRFDGNSWKTTYLAQAGTKLYDSEQDYTGLGALDPNDPNVIYISTPYNPNTDQGDYYGKKEIWKGVSCDNGASFTWEPVTANSTMDNLRPVVPKWDENNTALLWMRGDYHSAQNYDTEIVGVIYRNQPPSCQTAVNSLDHLVPSAQSLGQLLANRFVSQSLSFASVANLPGDGYKTACEWYGSLGYAASPVESQSLLNSLVSKFDVLKEDFINAMLGGSAHVDRYVFGIVPFEIYLQTGDESYLSLGTATADNQQVTNQTRGAIDDMFMMTALQLQAYRATGEVKYINYMADIMLDYLRFQQTNGLFFHNVNQARVYWGRGNGWFAAGMAEIIRDLPQSHQHYQTIVDGYKRMMAGLLSYQSDNGLWYQVLNLPYDSNNWEESSSSAMFTYAMIVGVRRGILDAATYVPVIEAAWQGLQSKIDSQGDVRDICVGTWYHSTPQEYMALTRLTGDGHGQAPVLWVTAALLR
jgi:rhamnogalacturonyl hydrolase YesR